MKLARFAAIVAGAGIVEVIAVPLLVISNNVENAPSVNVRFGHAVPMLDKAYAVPVLEGIHRTGEPRMKIPCGGRRANRFHQKAVEVSNLLRQALGLPLIQSGDRPGHYDSRLRTPFIGTTPPFVPGYPDRRMEWVKLHHSLKSDNSSILLPRPLFAHHVYIGNPVNQFNQLERLRVDERHLYHTRHHIRQGSFVRRFRHALKNLSRWEGRAVMFVLGWGVGTLLRMIWVLGIVMYRVVKRRRNDEHDHSQIAAIEENVCSPQSIPPTYPTYTPYTYPTYTPYIYPTYTPPTYPTHTPPTYTYLVDEKVAFAAGVSSTTEESK